MAKVSIYTDGSSPENSLGHGRGGWCAILVSGDREKVISGALTDTTNNVAELTAICKGLEALLTRCEVTVYTDSRFCIGTLTQGWKRKNERCARVSSKIDELMKKHNVKFVYVAGHSGHEYNERADKIAREMADTLK